MSLLPSRSDASPPDDAGPRVVGVDSDDADELLSALSSGTARELLTAVHENPAPPSELADQVDTSLQNVQYHLENLEEAGAVEVVDTAYSAKGREMDVYAAADQPLVIFAGGDDESDSLRAALKRFLGAIGVLAAGSVVVQTVFGEGALLPSLGGSGGADGGVPSAGTDTPADGGDGGLVGNGGDAGATATQTDVMTRSPSPTHEVTETQGLADTATQTETAVRTATETAVPTSSPTPTPTPTETLSAVPTETATDAAPAAGSALPPGLLFFAGGLLALGVVAGVWYLRG